MMGSLLPHSNICTNAKNSVCRNSDRQNASQWIQVFSHLIFQNLFFISWGSCFNEENLSCFSVWVNVTNVFKLSVVRTLHVFESAEFVDSVKKWGIDTVCNQNPNSMKATFNDANFFHN